MNSVTIQNAWIKMFDLLMVYKEREGHCNVPFFHIEGAKKLGIWLNNQRQQKKRGDLDYFLEIELENVGIVWDDLSEEWEKNYCLLIKFQQREGHPNIPGKHVENGMKLGSWLCSQRQQKKKGKLDGSLVKRLENVGVVWNVHSEQWLYNYFLLVKFQQREGHSNVPGNYVVGGMLLGRWLAKQRQLKKKGKLDRGLEKQLENVGIMWNVHSEQWENNYRLLLKFQQRKGHSNVPRTHIEGDIKLGNWLYTQRLQKKKNKLDGSLKKRLEDAGVMWDVHPEQWERNYCLLVKFQKREGHPNVPIEYIEDGIGLGDWLSNQREEKKERKLDSSCERRLDEIGVLWALSS